MKPSRPLIIYIASSFRNVHAVRMLAAALVEVGHKVLDWTPLAPPLPAGMRPEERRAVLDSDARGRIFDFCAESCAGADLVIYLGESGKDTSFEIGLAWGAGVPVYGLAGWLEAPGLMLARGVARWFERHEALLDAVEALAEDLYAKEHPEKDDMPDALLCGKCGKNKAIYYGGEGALCMACSNRSPWL